jgi:glycine/D-amino acid oxidase-like deaminating enzyme
MLGPDRRLMLLGGLAGLAGCTTRPSSAPGLLAAPDRPLPIAPIRAHKDRLFDITVCLRPFRAQGPRMDTEMLGNKLVIHNYGHGGSGWSLSWGSAALALEKAMTRSPSEIAVIGCGALGLTAAITALRAGVKVTIYCKELLQQSRSIRATGGWTPDSRISLREPAGPQFADTWERMARISWKTYRSYLGLADNPVCFSDRYSLSDIPFAEARERAEARNTMGFASYMDRIADITARPQVMPDGTTPFATKYVRRSQSLQFNLHAFAHLLLSDFRSMGGKIEMREFHTPAEIAQLKETVVINCTGYGARALWKDDSVVPVRGQVGWLIPQAEVTYGLSYRDVYVLSRTDGIVVLATEGGDMKGYNDDREVVNRAESDTAVSVLEDLYSRFRT